MTYLHFYCIFVNGALYLHFFKGLLHVLNRIGYQHHILFFYHERSTMLYNNIIKNRKVYVAWTHGHVGLKQWVFFFWLFFVFRVRLREHFRLFIVLAVYHEKITKQNKRASCKKNKKKPYREKKLFTIFSPLLVRFTLLQFHRLPQYSHTFDPRQSVISYFNVHLTWKNVSGYNLRRWRPDASSNEKNHCEDGCWRKDIHSKEPQPFEVWMTWSWWWPCGWWSERGQLGKRWEWRKCRRWRWRWWSKGRKWWRIEGWNRWLRWWWDVEDGKQHEQGSHGEIFGFWVGGGAGGHQD